MSSCTHKREKPFFWVPKTLIHNEHNHDCGCLKCYINNIISATKTEFIFLIDNIVLLKIFNSEPKKLKKYIISSSFTTRSPPSFI